jgi:hypothetical protein
MAGAKAASEEKAEQELPPHAAGREVLSYVQRLEKEADEDFAAVHGIDPEKEKIDDDKKGVEGSEKKAEGEEPEKVVDKEPEDKQPEGKDKVAEGDGKVAEGDDDLTKGLSTENAQKRISSAQSKMHDSNARATTAEGERDRLKEQNEALQKKLDTVPEAQAAAEPGKEPEKKVASKADEEDDLKASMEELNQEYPEIAKPMLKMMARQEIENKKLSDQVATLVEKEETRTAEAVTVKENTHVKAISDAHKDYKEISEEPLLDDWIESLPAIERAGARAIKKAGSSTEVIELLTSFKKANGYELPADSKEDIPAKKSNSKIEKAKAKANPSFNKSKDVNIQDGQVEFTRQEIDAMSPAEFAEKEPAIDLAMSKGLVR